MYWRNGYLSGPLSSKLAIPSPFLAILYTIENTNRREGEREFLENSEVKATIERNYSNCR